jgi:hypothetical protein
MGLDPDLHTGSAFRVAVSLTGVSPNEKSDGPEHCAPGTILSWTSRLFEQHVPRTTRFLDHASFERRVPLGRRLHDRRVPNMDRIEVLAVTSQFGFPAHTFVPTL